VKLDKELVRDILLKLDADDSDPRLPKEISVPGWTRSLISYHIEQLSEGNLVAAVNFSSGDGHDWQAKRLTYSGHEFLDTVRDGEVWRKTKEVANKTGVYSLQVLMEAGKMVVKQKLMEHGLHLL
jgi:Hypothetical protein (DUF2513)